MRRLIQECEQPIHWLLGPQRNTRRNVKCWCRCEILFSSRVYVPILRLQLRVLVSWVRPGQGLFSPGARGVTAGWLTHAGQTEQGIPYRVPSCWVLVWELPGGKAVAAQKHVGHWAVRVAICISLLVLYIFVISIVVVTVLFICCSVKLHSFRPMSFPVFLPFLSHPSRGRGDRATAWPFVASHGQTKTPGKLRWSLSSLTSLCQVHPHRIWGCRNSSLMPFKEKKLSIFLW